MKGSNDGDSKEERVKPGISGSLAVGAFVGWCLNTSPNGVFNFFTDIPAFQLYPFCFSCWICLMIWAARLVIRHRNIPWMFMLPAVAGAALFVVTSEIVGCKEARIRAVRSPNVPWIEIKTQSGLSGPKAGGEITSEMNQEFREQHLLIRNSNVVDLRNFSARIELQERVIL